MVGATIAFGLAAWLFSLVGTVPSVILSGLVGIGTGFATGYAPMPYLAPWVHGVLSVAAAVAGFGIVAILSLVLGGMAALISQKAGWVDVSLSGTEDFSAPID